MKEQKDAFRDLLKAAAEELIQRDSTLSRPEGIYKLLDGQNGIMYQPSSRGQALSRMGSGVSETDVDFQASLHALFGT